jgi:hypothetical protein
MRIKMLVSATALTTLLALTAMEASAQERGARTVGEEERAALENVHKLIHVGDEPRLGMWRG